MMEDAHLMQRKIAYVDSIRGLHKTKRHLGFIGCLLGVVLMFAARIRPEIPDELVWVGVAIIAASWVLFAYVVFARIAFVRAHPFDPGA
jgi:dTDP-4-dehydrorhamnose 3,5-epimerase-like enzyme